MGLKQNQELVQIYPHLQFFVTSHLPPELAAISNPFRTLAWKMAKTLPRGPETSVAIRKILEGKDAAVRAFIAYDPNAED